MPPKGSAARAKAITPILPIAPPTVGAADNAIVLGDDDVPGPINDTVSWSSAADGLFVSILQLHKTNGRQAGSGWKPGVWTDAETRMKAELINEPGGIKTAAKLKTHWQKLKGDFKIVKTLREQSGFGWDSRQHLVTAPDNVWETYLAAHHKARRWRTKRFPLYDDIAALTGNVIATGRGAIRLGDNTFDVDSSDHEDASSKAPTDGMPEDSDVDEDDEPTVVKAEACTGKALGKRKSSGDDKAARKTKAPRQRASGANALFAMSQSIADVAAALGAPALISSTLDVSPVRRTRAIKAVQSNEKLDDDDLLAIINTFGGCTSKADTYLAFEPDHARLRTRWVEQEAAVAREAAGARARVTDAHGATSSPPFVG